jgi:hypothetical protein
VAAEEAVMAIVEDLAAAAENDRDDARRAASRPVLARRLRSQDA